MRAQQMQNGERGVRADCHVLMGKGERGGGREKERRERKKKKQYHDEILEDNERVKALMSQSIWVSQQNCAAFDVKKWRREEGDCGQDERGVCLEPGKEEPGGSSSALSRLRGVCAIAVRNGIKLRVQANKQ